MLLSLVVRQSVYPAVEIVQHKFWGRIAQGNFAHFDIPLANDSIAAIN